MGVHRLLREISKFRLRLHNFTKLLKKNIVLTLKTPEKLFFLVSLILILSAILYPEIKSEDKPLPNYIFIQVLDPDGYPEVGASCKGLMKYQGKILFDEQPLESVDSIFEYLSPNHFQGSTDKGFYLLDTRLEFQVTKDYEIRIVCYSPGFRGVSYTIMNSTNMPCEVVYEKGGFILC